MTNSDTPDSENLFPIRVSDAVRSFIVRPWKRSVDILGEFFFVVSNAHPTYAMPPTKPTKLRDAADAADVATAGAAPGGLPPSAASRGANAAEAARKGAGSTQESRRELALNSHAITKRAFY